MCALCAPAEMPRTIHYGLLWSVDDWSFDKHWYFDFNPHMCPPWNTSATRPKHGLFPAPPHPSTVKSAKVCPDGSAHSYMMVA